MLDGKNAVITGSNRGIGLAVMEEFAKCGCNVWACARRPDPEFEGRIARLSAQYGVWIKPVYFELSAEASVKAGAREIRADKKPVDILVNNAGIAYTGLFSLTPADKLREIFEVNFFALALLSQQIAQIMLRRKSGSIVNIASTAGLESHAGDVAYGTSKAAVISFTRLFAAEVAALGIRVNAVAPGPTQTDMIGLYGNRALLADVAMERLARPDEIARCVRFLASGDASFITGQVVPVNGGRK